MWKEENRDAVTWRTMLPQASRVPDGVNLPSVHLGEAPARGLRPSGGSASLPPRRHPTRHVIGCTHVTPAHLRPGELAGAVNMAKAIASEIRSLGHRGGRRAEFERQKSQR
jgi:hypothetical protein